MSDNLTTQDTIISVWHMAAKSNAIAEQLIFHSDRGSQYASYAFTDIIKSYNGLVKQSMSRTAQHITISKIKIKMNE